MLKQIILVAKKKMEKMAISNITEVQKFFTQLFMLLVIIAQVYIGRLVCSRSLLYFVQ